jgi:RNA-directed DNA polymerase
MEITGIVINEFPNVKRVFVDRIRGGLHAWQKHGYDNAQVGWEKRVADGAVLPYEKRPWKRQTRLRKTPELKNVLWGKLLFVRMVRGADDSIYTRLAEKYNHLVAEEEARNTKFSAPHLPVERIVRSAEDVEHAVFVVEWCGDYRPSGSEETTSVYSQGTAFAYKRHDRLITCNHVLVVSDSDNNGAPFTADIDEVPGATLTAANLVTGQVWDLRVLHRDPHRDLAILEF